MRCWTVGLAGTVIGMALALSCTESNPKHCANTGFQCDEGRACDRCAVENNGCVAAPQCPVETDSGSGTTGTTGTDSGSETG